jgi:hypothetical protein
VSLNLAHVCRRWRAIMFASSSRLDLSITVGPRKPGHIETILSGHLPILIDYSCLYHYGNCVDRRTSLAALFGACVPHLDIVIACSRPPFKGVVSSSENLSGRPIITFPYWRALTLALHVTDIPATFLGGPDQLDLRLQRLRLYGAPLASVSGLLLSSLHRPHFER